jgi:hypothetical protein
MHRKNLRETLEKLRLELDSTANNLDEQLHAALKEVADDIETALGDEPVEVRPGKEQLQEMAVKFETEHPRLANILGELTDTLSKMGI